MNEKLAEFEGLCDAAAASYRRGDDALVREPYYLAVLHFMEENLDLRSMLASHFASHMRLPSEEYFPLIKYCMHTLRWEEIREMAIELRAMANSSKAQKWMEMIVESFDPKWKGRGVYDHYRGKDVP